MLQDQRVVSTSAVRCVGNTLILQGRVYSPPYLVTAIGRPRQLRTRWRPPGGQVLPAVRRGRRARLGGRAAARPGRSPASTGRSADAVRAGAAAHEPAAGPRIGRPYPPAYEGDATSQEATDPGARTRILVVDNYDSFVWTIVGYLAQLGADCDVRRNDDDGAGRRPRASTVSCCRPAPGPPRTPGSAGDHRAPVPRRPGRRCSGSASGTRRSARRSAARSPTRRSCMHGKTSQVTTTATACWPGLPDPFTATRYHSLAWSRTRSRTSSRSPAGPTSGVVMALRHRDAAAGGGAVPPRVGAHRGRPPDAGQLARDLRGRRRGTWRRRWRRRWTRSAAPPSPPPSGDPPGAAAAVRAPWPAARIRPCAGRPGRRPACSVAGRGGGGRAGASRWAAGRGRAVGVGVVGDGVGFSAAMNSLTVGRPSTRGSPFGSCRTTVPALLVVPRRAASDVRCREPALSRLWSPPRVWPTTSGTAPGRCDVEQRP